jgi:hypothetical protein
MREPLVVRLPERSRDADRQLGEARRQARPEAAIGAERLRVFGEARILQPHLQRPDHFAARSLEDRLVHFLLFGRKFFRIELGQAGHGVSS